MKRIFGTGRYANVTATVALVVALGGTSYAAVKLPANSVTSKTVKDKTLLKKDFKPGQLPAGARGPAGPSGSNGSTGSQGLRGQDGSAGPAGPAGPQGAKGDMGPAGSGIPAVFKQTEAALPFTVTPRATSQTVQSINLPAGNWVVTAKVIAVNATQSGNDSDSRLSCNLTFNGSTSLDSLGAGGVDFGAGANSYTLTGAGNLGSAGTATVQCQANDLVLTGDYRARSMTAVQASTLAAG